MPEDKDFNLVHLASIVAGHGLMQFFVDHPDGEVYVLGDKHYTGLSLGEMVIINQGDIVAIPKDRKALIQVLEKKPNYGGVIPATPGALEDVTELGMQRIAEGRVVKNIPPIPDGIKPDVYK